ncbi:uncharacterized protein LOC132888964 [Neoarius graeffei]|uniref:uncharacterized protein LOC132888964 n=1 Tax=Neoarius graeffei TaxID=443677 RepID=UPI00298C7D19|nr:uncharacterized protein LOC132888964 [Neoarius graeffei]
MLLATLWRKQSCEGRHELHPPGTRMAIPSKNKGAGNLCTFAKARRYLTRSLEEGCLTADLQSDDGEMGPRKRRPNKRYLEEDSEEEAGPSRRGRRPPSIDATQLDSEWQFPSLNEDTQPGLFLHSQPLTHGVAPSHWFRYVDDTLVKIKTHEVEAFSKHVNAVDININFTREDISGNNLAFLDCDVHIRQDRSLSIEVYRKLTHTDQYLLFDSHHPLEHKLGVISTLQHRAQNIPTMVEGKEKEQNHIRKALQNCGYPNWSFFKSRKRNITDKEDNRNKRKNIVIPYISGLSEKLRRICYKHNIPVCFRPSNTLKQKLVHPKDRIPKHKQDNVVYAIQCSEECTDSYIGETKQPLHRRMAQHRRASSSGQDSAVYLHLNNKGHSFQDCKVCILAIYPFMYF